MSREKCLVRKVSSATEGVATFFWGKILQPYLQELESTVSFVTEPQERTTWERLAEPARQGESNGGRPGPPSFLHRPEI
jgi:hypothetical protein